MDLKLRYQKRKALQTELAGRFGFDCFIVHIASGMVCPATVENAAAHIVDGTHKLPEPSELAAYQNMMKLRAEEIAAKTRQMSGTNYRPDSREMDPNARLFRF